MHGRRRRRRASLGESTLLIGIQKTVGNAFELAGRFHVSHASPNVHAFGGTSAMKQATLNLLLDWRVLGRLHTSCNQHVDRDRRRSTILACVAIVPSLDALEDSVRQRLSSWGRICGPISFGGPATLRQATVPLVANPATLRQATVPLVARLQSFTKPHAAILPASADSTVTVSQM